MAFLPFTPTISFVYFVSFVVKYFMESLSDKLKSLGVKQGAGGLPKPKTRPATSITQVIPGQIVETAFGEAFVVESWYETTYRHGLVQFSSDLNLQMITEWGHAGHLEGSGFPNLMFLDTETTGLGGGTGTYPFLVGLGHLTENGFHLIQLLMRDPTEERSQLALLSQYLEPFPAVVTYNGKSFDIPLLNARHTLNGFTTPFPSMDHLDLLPLARRLWRNRLPSRALGDLEVEIMGVTRTQEEIPGWMIPQVYFDYLRTGDARPLVGVMYHNAMDILSLAALFHHVAHLLSDPLHYTEPQSLDLIAIARLYEELGRLDDAVRLYEFSLDLGLPEDFFVQTLQRFAELHRRRGNWDSTVSLWEKAAAHHQLEACVELAKYYEHQCRDCRQALLWTETAYRQVDQVISGLAHRRRWKQELDHRRERLNRKLAGNGRE